MMTIENDRRDRIIAKLKGIYDLPSLPEIVLKVQNEIVSPNVDTAKVAAIIKGDPAISAMVLKIANSALYGSRRRIVDINDAVIRLGYYEIYNIVLSITTLKIFNSAEHVSHVLFWRHSVSTALGAKAVAEFYERARGAEPDRTVTSAAYTAGLLHDMGVLALDQYFTDVYRHVVTYPNGTAMPLYEIEREKLGITHAEAGGYLLKRWGVPDAITTAVAQHIFPDLPVPDPIARYVHIADYICNTIGYDNGARAVADKPAASLNVEVKELDRLVEIVRLEAEKYHMMVPAF